MEMEFSGLYTEENLRKLLEAGKMIDSSAKEEVNKKGQRYINIFGNTPKDRVTLWVASRHFRIYAGKNTRYFNMLEDDPDYKYSDKERRMTFYDIDDMTEFVKKLCKERNISNDNNDAPSDPINIPMKPKDIVVNETGEKVFCPRCDRSFKRAKRCPGCGQLIDYSED